MEINADLLEKEAYEIKEEQKQEEKQQEYLAQSDDEQIEIRERQSIHIGGHKEPMMEGFREASIKDEIDELAGEIPKAPQYVGMDSKFAVVQKDDTPACPCMPVSAWMFRQAPRQLLVESPSEGRSTAIRRTSLQPSRPARPSWQAPRSLWSWWALARGEGIRR